MRHPTLTNYCYARVGDSDSADIIYNDQTPMTDGLQVWVSRDALNSPETPGAFRVTGMRTTAPSGVGATVGALSLEAIASALEYKRPGGGTNPLWVRGMQISPLRVGEVGGLFVQIQDGAVDVGGG